MTNVVCINGNIIGRTLGNGGNGVGVIKDGTCYTLTAMTAMPYRTACRCVA
ncbi:hypothetical protein [Cardiobacterium valvarum]|uniref:hypothetical protein n=1 Tax=Cardiobacterium valvarum TaxID=194702 RepID=UPI0002DA265D|nr:hypothetical protein [Cardiobacterium valvarum]